MLVVCSLNEVHLQSHGSHGTEEGELKASLEREDELICVIDLQGST